MCVQVHIIYLDIEIIYKHTQIFYTDCTKMLKQSGKVIIVSASEQERYSSIHYTFLSVCLYVFKITSVNVWGNSSMGEIFTVQA